MSKFHKKLYKLDAVLVVLADDKEEAIDLGNSIVRNTDSPFTINSHAEEINSPESIPEDWEHISPVKGCSWNNVSFHDLTTTEIVGLLQDNKQRQYEKDIEIGKLQGKVADLEELVKTLKLQVKLLKGKK